MALDMMSDFCQTTHIDGFNFGEHINLYFRLFQELVILFIVLKVVRFLWAGLMRIVKYIFICAANIIYISAGRGERLFCFSVTVGWERHQHGCCSPRGSSTVAIKLIPFRFVIVNGFFQGQQQELYFLFAVSARFRQIIAPLTLVVQLPNVCFENSMK